MQLCGVALCLTALNPYLGACILNIDHDMKISRLVVEGGKTLSYFTTLHQTRVAYDQ
jgi:hypothetical protein